MTPVDPFARPELPDPGPRTPLDPSRPEIHGDGSTTYDFFSPPTRAAEEAGSYAPEPPYDGPPVYAPEPAYPSAPAYPAAPPGAPVFTPPRFIPGPQDPPTIELGGPMAPTVGYEHPAPRVETAPPVLPAPAAAAESEGPGPLYVVGDVHGYLQALLDALHQAGIIDAEGHWSAGPARIWFLGDFTDRGPDGIGVIDLVMNLAAEAAASGGYCRALMGNHELLLLGADRYGDQAVQSTAGTASFLAAWRLNGGQPTDMERLQDHHVTWLSRLPAMAVEDDHLLVHSDTTAYLEYGDSVDAVNDAIHEVLQGDEADDWWDCFRRMTKRFAFRGDAGPSACHELLDAYGGRRIVHGHSPIPYLVGDAQSEDGPAGNSGHPVTGPHIYADGLAVAMDGGVTMEGQGRLLVARLPLN
ncbi:serine/threonine protein phosphatase [Streptacidiphilus sp. PB12-B1b]|uniref:metallophosphoesterase n=1 Tax=Streptacidiphilus sp. PB12-B1b TaxID=2705012 RepID=UPI0015FD728D|nr:metallophosphoesterase [Streptacidiphilus sp. PB12-B1b]QMU74471.1 serine/threonine protein phosphatase [Streptacidiphilus sp. PB12-B1b]